MGAEASFLLHPKHKPIGDPRSKNASKDAGATANRVTQPKDILRLG
jgi:hypothetical protein